MKKTKVGVIFGGMSTENKVSEESAKSILKNIDTKKYEIYPIYIGEDGTWYKYNEREEIQNIIKYLQNLDVLFPVLHGLYGEDGSIQGLFKMIQKPYVGPEILASSIGMDKAYTKIIFEKAGLNQAKYEYIKKYQDKYIYIDKKFNEEIMQLENIIEKIEKNLKYPMFVKPSNSGSSVGIGKAKNKEELKKYIEEASKFDKKILIEEGIVGKEVECAVMGNEEVISSVVGEIKTQDEFYSYNAKYKDEKSKVQIPAQIRRRTIWRDKKTSNKSI